MTHINDLKTFLETLTPQVRSADASEIGKSIDAKYISNGPWTVWKNPPWIDFTRELIEPGYKTDPKEGEPEEYPEGAITIRGDIDFWIVAVLPRRFEAIPMTDIVRLLWPDIEKPTIYPDTGDVYWEALDNHDMEVPGEPFELWVDYPPTSGIEPSNERLITYSSVEALSKVLLDVTTQNAEQEKRHPGISAKYYGQAWKAGTRSVVAI
jgi:hypothetical protein